MLRWTVNYELGTILKEAAVALASYWRDWGIPQDDVLDKNRTMDNVHKHNICIIVPSSQVFKSFSVKIIGVLTEVRTEYFPSTPLLLEPGRSQKVMLSPLGTSANNWPIVPAPDHRWRVWSGQWNENWEDKPKYSEKTCPSATLSTTNPTWLDLGSNQSRPDGNPVTNGLSYGTASDA
jgi:hypothetical protein